MANVPQEDGEFYPRDNHLPYLQQIIPPSLVSKVFTSMHDSLTSGHLGVFKTMEKIRERFFWPGFKDDVKLHIEHCDKCQKRANPPKTHRHSLIDWRVSYPFHHISIDFIGTLPPSNGNHHFL